jgi:hypothetical protein
MTDRGFWVAGMGGGLNVRRLMYQSLIWTSVLRDDARGLGAPFDTKDSKGLANALVDRVRRDVELGRDFLGGQKLVDEAKAVELAGRKPGDALGNYVLCARVAGLVRRVMHLF